MISVGSFLKTKHDLDLNVKNRGFVRLEALSRIVDLCRFKNISLQELERIQPEKQFQRIVEQFQNERTFTVKCQKKIDQLSTRIAELRARIVQPAPKKEEKPVRQLFSQVRATATSQKTESFTGKMTRFAVISCVALAAITCVALTIATYQPDDESSSVEGICSYANPAYLNQQIPTRSKGGTHVKGETAIEEGGLMGIANRLIIENGKFVVNDARVFISSKEKSNSDALTQAVVKKTAKIFVEKTPKILSTAARLLQGKS